MMNQKDIVTRVKVRLRGKYSESEIEFISNHFFETLRYYLSHPEECKEGVHLQGFLDFRLRFSRMIKVLNNTEKVYPERMIQSFTECLKNYDEQQKRQTRSKKVDERNDESQS